MRGKKAFTAIDEECTYPTLGKMVCDVFTSMFKLLSMLGGCAAALINKDENLT